VLDLHSPLLRRLYEDWDRRRNGRAFPARSDFDVLDLGYIIGNVSLLDVRYDPLRFRYRLHGTNIAQRAGVDLTGKNVEDVPDIAWRAGLLKHFRAVIEQRRPVAITFRRAWTDHRFWNCESLALPLSREGNTIDMLMTSVVWSND